MAIYMKFGDIKGQVKTDGFKDWIECGSFQFGIGRGVTSGEGGQQRESSNPSVSEIVLTKVYDAASSGLFQDSLKGNFNTKVNIKFTSTSAGKVATFLTFDLEECGLSGYSWSSGGDNPSESLSLNFTKITMSPSPLDDKGSPVSGSKVSYDLATHVCS